MGFKIFAGVGGGGLLFFNLAAQVLVSALGIFDLH